MKHGEPIQAFRGEPFLDTPEHELENGDNKAETLRKGSEKGSKRLKFEHIRDDLKSTRSGSIIQSH